MGVAGCVYKSFYKGIWGGWISSNGATLFFESFGSLTIPLSVVQMGCFFR